MGEALHYWQTVGPMRCNISVNQYASIEVTLTFKKLKTKGFKLLLQTTLKYM